MCFKLTFERSSFEVQHYLALLTQISKPLSMFFIRKLRDNRAKRRSHCSPDQTQPFHQVPPINIYIYVCVLWFQLKEEPSSLSTCETLYKKTLTGVCDTANVTHVAEGVVIDLCESVQQCRVFKLTVGHQI